jgi:glycosyltransferase A (GT-A) superfamily protein (DUF2064 family)
MRLHPESLARGVPALVVMCTRPRLGGAKTRAAAASEERAAFELAQALIDCAIEDAEAWAGPVVLALAQPNDLQWAGTVARGEWSIVGQTGGNPGERINAVDQVLRRHGARALVFVGTTAALRPQSDYTTVCDLLASSDIVVMPAPSGGAALMAARRPWPDLATLSWNTRRLSAELSYLCEREGLSVARLERRAILESHDDLARIVEANAEDTRPKRQALVALARRILESQPVSP